MGVLSESDIFNPIKWKWKNGTPFIHYSIKRGIDIISFNIELEKLAKTKWIGEIQFYFSYN